MDEVKWIKITTDIFDDDKIKLIEAMPDGYALITVWFKLLCLAGKQNNHGVFLITENMPYTDEMFATIFRMPLTTVRLALQTFKSFDMVDIVEGVTTIPKWEKHQNLDALERNRELTKNRVRQYRARQKQLAETNVTLPLREVTQTEEEREEDIEEDIKRKSKKEKFTPPTLEEVKEYVQERNSNVDPIKFWDYYETGGWKDSKGNPVKNWKQKLLTWEKKDGVKNDVKRNAPVSNDPNKFLKQDSFMKAIADLQKG